MAGYTPGPILLFSWAHSSSIFASLLCNWIESIDCVLANEKRFQGPGYFKALAMKISHIHMSPYFPLLANWSGDLNPYLGKIWKPHI